MNRIAALAFSLAVTTSTALADYPVVRMGRYTALAPVPSEAQANPLHAVATVAFPPETATVGAAIDRLLLGSGYRMVGADELAGLLAQPLPHAHRHLGPLRLAMALEVLAGPAFRLVVDHRHRLVSFEPLPVYKALGGES